MAKDLYPDHDLREYVIRTLASKGVLMKDIAMAAWKGQQRFNKDLEFINAAVALNAVLDKREALNSCAIALALDEVAGKGLLPQPLQYIVENDLPQYGVDEVLALHGMTGIYGTVALMQTGYLDLNKSGVTKKLDEDVTNVNTHIDDVVSALIAMTEAKLMHDNVSDLGDVG